MPGRHQVIEKRADMRREADYKFTMRIARRRFKVERHLGRHDNFRTWARKTYGAHAVTGKLKAIVAR